MVKAHSRIEIVSAYKKTLTGAIETHTLRLVLVDLGYPTLDVDTAQRLLAIPGVRIRKAGLVLAPVDIATHVAEALGLPSPIIEAKKRTLSLAPSQVRGWEQIRSYQQEDALALARDEKRLEWACTGSGKTLVVLAALDLVGASRALIITSAKGRKNWALDVRIASSRRVCIVVGRKPSKGADAEAKRLAKRLEELKEKGVDATATTDFTASRGYDTVVMTWEIFTASKSAYLYGKIKKTAENRMAEVLSEAWDVVVFDEHHKAKNWRSGRTSIADEIVNAKPHGKKPIVWGVTATPITDRRRDLLAQLNHVAPDAWNSFTDLKYGDDVEPHEPDWKPAFTTRYCCGHYGPFGEWDDTGPHSPKRCVSCARVGKLRSAELEHRLDYWAIRRSYQSLINSMPRKTRKVVSVPFDTKALRAATGHHGREALLAIAFANKIDTAIEDAMEILIGRGKLVLVVGNRNEWTDIANEKLDRVLARNRPVREGLWRETAHEDVSKRIEQAERYGAQQHSAIFVSTIGKIAESMNGLQFSHAAFMLGLPQTYLEIAQTEGRFSRVDGWPVTVTYYVSEATIDEPLDAALFSKIEGVETSGVDTVGDRFVGLRKEVPREGDVRKTVLEWIRANAKKIEGACEEIEE